MEELSQEYILSIVCKNALEREELFKKKCEYYYEQTENKEIKNLLKDMRNKSENHMNDVKDKMIKLKIIG